MNEVTMHARKLAVIAFALMALFVGGLTQRAYAEAPIPSEVLVVLASQGNGGIAPELRNIQALRQAPFNTFSELRLLERATPTLDAGRPVERLLPNGRTLRIELLEQTTTGRYRVRVSIQRQGSNDYLPLLTVVASRGVPFFVAGQSFQGGTLVIGLKIGS